jgi:Rha family phage regulatory protein
VSRGWGGATPRDLSLFFEGRVLNELTIRDGFTELGIFEKSEDAWTTSRDLARVFDKQHKDVLRQIEKTIDDCDADFGRRNFALSSYKNQQNKKQPQYLMTRKGFSLVAMGFTGKKAMEFKVAYIEAFENMAELIFSRIHAKVGYREMTSAIANHLDGGPYVYAEEANRVNRAVLGMTSSEFHQVHGLKTGESPRDAVVKAKLDQLDKAQRLNSELIKAGIVGHERTRILEANYRAVE